MTMDLLYKSWSITYGGYVSDVSVLVVKEQHVLVLHTRAPLDAVFSAGSRGCQLIIGERTLVTLALIPVWPHSQNHM